MENLLESRGAEDGKLTVGEESIHQDVLGVAVVALLLVVDLHPNTAANVGLHPPAGNQITITM